MGYDGSQTYQKLDNADITLTITNSTTGFRLSPGVIWAGYASDPAAIKELTIVSKSKVTPFNETVLGVFPISDKGVRPYDLTKRYTRPGENLKVVLPASGTGGNNGYLSIASSDY